MSSLSEIACDFIKTDPALANEVARQLAPKTGLTPRQRDALKFISDYAAKNGVSPSFEDIQHGLGLHSRSGVSRLVDALIERGCLLKLSNRARSLTVLRAAA
ncbi:LexA family protein [Limoniibacter endophyticus]|uniref:LexA repressor DNA-binding domain-containing protein n=1 Tax=Limoniibacter endophyticus TaxID=1565040 RepID=A0A8J3DQ91_9HYPH|nr:hypothetical protein [Limoniibacter endophyticus]GHC79555.1 hypothetical protein GCM10010136_32210 [Limoniibacter endophyticus]